MMPKDPRQFVELFNSYLSAFNDHNLEKTLSFLSPSLVAYFDGREVCRGHDSLAIAYTSHWANLTQPVYCLDEPKELEGADGVEVTIADCDGQYRVKVKYFFTFEDGKWLHIRHEITERVKLDVGTGPGG
jgi:hypothetical protein